MSAKAKTEILKIYLLNFFCSLFFISPVIVFFYQSRGLDFSQILFLESVLTISIFLFEIPTGVFSDRFGRKKSIVAGAALNLLSIILFILARNYIVFVTCFAISGIAITFFSGTLEAIIYDNLKSMGKEDQMNKAIGSLGAFSSFAALVAPIIGSILAKDLKEEQFRLLLYLTLLGTLIGFIVSLLIREPKSRNANSQSSFRIFKQGFILIKENQYLRQLVMLNVFSSPFLYCLLYLYQPFLKRAGVPIAFFGTIAGIATALEIISQKMAHRVERKIGTKRFILLVTVIPGVMYLLMSLTYDPFWSVLIFILIRGVIAFRWPAFSDYLNREIPDEIRATALSIISMFGSFYLVVMRIVIGKIADRSLSFAFVVMGSIIIATSVILEIRRRAVLEN